MEVLSGPWAGMALLFRRTISQTNSEMDSFFPLWLFCLLLFLPVCLLLLQLIVYFSWKLRQVEDDLSEFPQGRGAIYRHIDTTTALRRRRSVG